MIVGHIAEHEARHAAAGLLLGMPVHSARADAVDDRLGLVMLGPGPARDWAVAVLVGYPFRDGWPPDWPQSSGDGRGDESLLADFVADVRLDRAGWRALCSEARALVGTPEFRRLAAAITEPLLEGRVLDRGDLLALKRRCERPRQVGRSVALRLPPPRPRPLRLPT